MSSANLSGVAGYGLSCCRASSTRSERFRLILGSALVLVELVAVVWLLGWLDRQEECLARAGISIEQLLQEGQRHE